jgi:hypothetical protein
LILEIILGRLDTLRFLSFFIYDDDEYFIILFVIIVVDDGGGGRCFALNHIKQSCGSLGNNNNK